MNLSPEDRALVLESRAHWKRMRDDPEGCREEPGPWGCALCREYLNVVNGSCTRCPVMLITKIMSCRGTPYVGTSALYERVVCTGVDTYERYTAIAKFQAAADLVIMWIDEHLLRESPEPNDSQPTCPKCGSTNISLHLCFKDNSAGCRSCRHQWIMDTALAVNPHLLGEAEPVSAVIPEPEELRRLLIESTKDNRETTEKIVDIVCGGLPEGLTDEGGDGDA